MNKQKLAVCAIFENEAPYLPEWIAYHRLIGVEHFVLYDSGSTDDPARALRGTSLGEHVTLIRWPQQPGHLAAYRHFIDIYAPGFEWVAFLDVDEFLLPLNSRKVADTLDWLTIAAAVLVQRRVFGPGTWQEPPWGLVMENCQQRAPDDFPGNRRVKTIARCSQLLDVTQNPNEFRLDGPVFNAGGHLAPNSAIQAQPCYQNLVINHYYTRSRQDWLAKQRRNDATDAATTPEDEPGLFDRLAEVRQVPDATIQPFAAAVRDLLGLDAAVAPPPDALGSRPPVAAVPPAEQSPSAERASPVAPALPLMPASSAVPAPSVGPESAVAGSVAAPMPGETETAGARPELPSQRDKAAAASVSAAVPVSAATPGAATAPVAVATKVAVSPAWVARGQDAQERAGGLGLVFRDRSRDGEHWLAALRGTAVAAIDPAFLLDEFDRIRDFPTDTEARAACEAALSRQPAH
jgi:hypothetical protein